MSNIKNYYNNFSYNDKLALKMISGMSVVMSMLFAGMIYSFKKEKQNKIAYYNKHQHDVIQVTKENNQYRFTDSRTLDSTNYKFSVAKDKKDSLEMIKNNQLFGKTDKHGLTLSQFKDGEFHKIINVSDFAIGKFVPLQKNEL